MPATGAVQRPHAFSAAAAVASTVGTSRVGLAGSFSSASHTSRVVASAASGWVARTSVVQTGSSDKLHSFG